MNTFKRCAGSLLLVAALAAAGCSGGGGGEEQGYNPPAPPQPPPPPPTGEGFTNWFKVGVYAQAADQLPVDMDTLVFNFDSNDNPDAFADLLPPEI